MNNAQEVKKQIGTLYANGVPEYPKLASEHLINSRVAHSVVSTHETRGFDVSFDGSLHVIHYADGSMLVVSSHGLDASA